jgi:hypothetical protein
LRQTYSEATLVDEGGSIVNGNDRILEWHELWREQCRAAEDIEERFGRRRALDYIVGEKFVDHLNASNIYPELARETPKFVAEIRRMYEPWEIADYLKDDDAKTVHIGDDYKLDHRDRELIVEDAERIVLLGRTRKLLVD